MQHRRHISRLFNKAGPNLCNMSGVTALYKTWRRTFGQENFFLTACIKLQVEGLEQGRKVERCSQIIKVYVYILASSSGLALFRSRIEWRKINESIPS